MPKLVDSVIRAARWLAPRSRRAMGRVVRLAVAVVILAGLDIVGCTEWLRFEARGHIFAVDDVPAAPVALVLGAQVYPDGSPSPFLVARLDIARQLYRAGKVHAILVSGDNSRDDYDEPDVMRQWLAGHDVPVAKVVADYAGS